MVWQDAALPPGTRIDAEREYELRLAAQARLGADWALSALVARYQPTVILYLTRLVGDSEQAAVLAERIFLRMERRVRGPQGGNQLRLWLLRASTEAGLDALRHPVRQPAGRIAAPNPAGLLADRVGASAQRMRVGFGKLAERTTVTSRQVRQLIWSAGPVSVPGTPGTQARRAASTAPRPKPQRPVSPDMYAADRHAEQPFSAETLDPREALRHRMVRAVLAELPYGDAQCLALHLVAGLNQTEVASALGLRPSAARRHIVTGLDRFAQRYEGELEQLGVPAGAAYTRIGKRQSPVASAAAGSPPDRGADIVAHRPGLPAHPDDRRHDGVDTPLRRDSHVPAAGAPAVAGDSPVWLSGAGHNELDGPRQQAATRSPGMRTMVAERVSTTLPVVDPASLSDMPDMETVIIPEDPHAPLAILSAPPSGPIIDTVAVSVPATESATLVSHANHLDLQPVVTAAPEDVPTQGVPHATSSGTTAAASAAPTHIPSATSEMPTLHANARTIDQAVTAIRPVKHAPQVVPLRTPPDASATIVPVRTREHASATQRTASGEQQHKVIPVRTPARPSSQPTAV